MSLKSVVTHPDSVNVQVGKAHALNLDLSWPRLAFLKSNQNLKLLYILHLIEIEATPPMTTMLMPWSSLVLALAMRSVSLEGRLYSHNLYLQNT